MFDVFINNACITEKSDFLSTTPELFDRICRVDYRGAFFCIQRAAQIMSDKNIKGSIILISSNNATADFADVAVYGSAKAAAEKMAEHAAIELAKYGIRVNSIKPSWTDTGSERLDAKEDTYYKSQRNRSDRIVSFIGCRSIRYGNIHCDRQRRPARFG